LSLYFFPHLITHLVDEIEIKKLYERFIRLDRDKSGTLSAEELLAIPEFAMNPFSGRLVTCLLYDKYSPNKQRELDFNGFIDFMNTFHPQTPVHVKLECMYSLD
jgi:Ca2+-binding EF-hand superfamily protein